LAPHVEARDHRAFAAQLRRIARRIAQHDRRAASFEAVAVGRPAGLESERANRNDVVAVHRDQAMGGANEADAGPAVGELVLHHLRDRQLGNRFVNDALQSFGEEDASKLPIKKEDLCLAIFPSLKTRDDRRICTKRAQALEKRRRWLFVGCEAHIHRHQLHVFSAFCALLHNVFDDNRKPAGSRVSLIRRLSNRELKANQAVEDTIRKLRAQ
jgi:hypothetical protein